MRFSVFLPALFAIAAATLSSRATAVAQSPPAPRGDDSMWVTTADYPAEALRAKVGGSVNVQLELDSEGRVQRFEILESSGSLLLDGTTCRLLGERASFYPAKNGAGKPAAASVTRRINWKMPKSVGNAVPELRAFRFSPKPAVNASGAPKSSPALQPAATYGPAAPAPRDRPQPLVWLKQSDYPPDSLDRREEGELTAQFDVNEAGGVENCRIIRSSGYLRLDDATCPLIEERVRYRPATDAAGKPIRSSAVRAWRWVLPSRGLVGPGGIVLTPN